VGGGLDLGLGLPALLVAGGLPAGARITIRVRTDSERDQRRVVVVRESGGVGEVIHPHHDSWFPKLSEFRAAEEGVREIAVRLAREPGRYRYVLAFVDPDEPVDWSLPTQERWETLRQAVGSGQVPAGEVWTVVRAAP